MYGPLLLIIICLPILIATIIFGKVSYAKYKKYEEQCEYFDSRPFHHEINFFHGSDWEYTVLKETGQEDKIPALEKAYKKYQFWKKFWCFEIPRDIIIGVCGVVVTVCTLVCIIVPTQARYEVAYWEEFVPMAQETFDNASEYEKVSIASDVVEYNTWLADARTSQKFWGNWSSYYGVDLSNLPMLTLRGQ